MKHIKINLEIFNQDISIAENPLLSVIIPTFNEQATLLSVLTQVAEEGTCKEIILVDDGSSDGTREMIASWIDSVEALNKQTARIIWLEHEQNLGKGTAIRSGLNVASGKYVVIQDADLEVLPSDYPQLIEPLINDQTEFVIGSRKYPDKNQLSYHRFGVRILNKLVRLLYGYDLSDAACCFKVLKHSDLLAMGLKCQRFEFCYEVIAKASRMGLMVTEVEVSYSPRSVVEGKKLRLVQDGFHAISTLMQYRFWNPKPVKFDKMFVASNQHE